MAQARVAAAIDSTPHDATEASVTELAARYDMSFAAVQKHVAVLERADALHFRAA